jgi:hypothetical protein
MVVFTKTTVLNQITSVPFQLSFNGQLVIVRTPCTKLSEELLTKTMKHCASSSFGGNRYKWSRVIIIARTEQLTEHQRLSEQMFSSRSPRCLSVGFEEALSLMDRMAGSSDASAVVQSLMGRSLPFLSNIHVFPYDSQEEEGAATKYVGRLLGRSMAASIYHEAARQELAMLSDFVSKTGLSWTDMLDTTILNPELKVVVSRSFERERSVWGGSSSLEPDPAAIKETFDPLDDLSLDDIVIPKRVLKFRKRVNRWRDSVRSAFERFAVDEWRSVGAQTVTMLEALGLAVIHRESGGDPEAGSPGGAHVGLGQVGRPVFKDFLRSHPNYTEHYPDLTFDWMSDETKATHQINVAMWYYSHCLSKASKWLRNRKVTGDPSLLGFDHIVFTSFAYAAGAGNTNKLLKRADAEGVKKNLPDLYRHYPTWMMPHCRPFLHGKIIFTLAKTVYYQP